MLANPLRKLAPAVALAVLVAVGAGCGSNPPCDTDIAAVDAARSAAATAEDKLEDAKSQKTQLENQISAETDRKAELEAKKAELEAKIAELGG